MFDIIFIHRVDPITTFTSSLFSFYSNISTTERRVISFLGMVDYFSLNQRSTLLSIKKTTPIIPNLNAESYKDEFPYNINHLTWSYNSRPSLSLYITAYPPPQQVKDLQSGPDAAPVRLRLYNTKKIKTERNDSIPRV